MNSVSIQKAKEFLNRKHQARNRKLHKRFEIAWIDFKGIIEMIISKYSPNRIYQWGSLLDENKFSEISDIDIAVEGIKSSEDFFALYGEATEMTEFPLDIVEMEKIIPEHADSIKQNGKIIYER